MDGLGVVAGSVVDAIVVVKIGVVVVIVVVLVIGGAPLFMIGAKSAPPPPPKLTGSPMALGVAADSGSPSHTTPRHSEAPQL